MTKLTRRALVGGLAGLAVTKARAEADWPARTITIIHGYAAGGPSDVVARIIADGLSKRLGQSVIVEPRPGASGITAAAQIARAAAEATRSSVIPSGHAFVAATFAKLPFRSIDDFTMITLASEYSYVMAVTPTAASTASPNSQHRPRPRDAAALRYAGHRFGPASRHRAVRAADQNQGSAYTVSRQRAGGDRTDRRAPRFHDGSADELDRVHPQRQAARARGFRARPAISPARYADHCRKRRSRFRCHGVAGADRAGGPARPDPPTPQYEVVGILKEPATIERLHAFANEPAPCSPEQFRERLAADIAKWTALADQIYFERI